MTRDEIRDELARLRARRLYLRDQRQQQQPDQTSQQNPTGDRNGEN